MIRRIASYAFIAVATFAAAGLYFIKYEVQALKEQNEQLEQAIYKEQMTYQLLQAEWAHLNHPVRLKRLARKHLNLEQATPEHMAAIGVLKNPLLMPASLASKVSHVP